MKKKPVLPRISRAPIPVATTSVNDEYIEERLRDLRTALRLREFLGASFEPRISDAEILVCFADVRGFTLFCRELQKDSHDRKVQNFLRDYSKIFNEGLISWYVEHVETSTNFDPRVEEACFPRMYKNLGDGMMIVWEIPDSLPGNAEGKLTHHIMLIIHKILERFYARFRNSSTGADAYSRHAQKLNFGIGVARGHAWKLDYGHSLDYAGSVINLASRLQDLARPNGIVAQSDVSPWLFDSLVDKGSGRCVTINKIKGYGEVHVWMSEGVEWDSKR